MTALLMILLVVLFVVVDVVVRSVSKKMETNRARRQRAAVLESSLQLSFADEARSLKRAEVPEARARILAVDDEAIILDSFRKILVLAGFSVDTVESGPEALTLLRARDYDFLFTDLKMPEMDGVEVVKAARHLRPDLDVVVITGYGTIETAVETMQFGAVDYAQKPFTEEELIALTEKLLIKREARLEIQRRPTVRVVAPAVAEIVAGGEYCVPGGAFVYPGHTWARIDPDGAVWTGLDDFARKALKEIKQVELPAVGTRVKRGDPLFTVKRDGESVRFRAPLSGEVTQVNTSLNSQPQTLVQSPYDRGWACVLQPSEIAAELEGLRIGQPVVNWYQDEVMRLRQEFKGEDLKWSELEAAFFGPGLAVNAPVTEAVGHV